MLHRMFPVLWMNLDTNLKIQRKLISSQLQKINQLETFAFSFQIFFCVNFESKCAVLGAAI